MSILRKAFSLLMALLLMGSFYLYALMREDEQTKRSEQWVVAEEQQPVGAMGGFEGTDPGMLARALGVDAPLPLALAQGSVRDAGYHGGYARILDAQGESVRVLGVRPAQAAPLIRDPRLLFSPSDKSLFSLPLMTAQDERYRYDYLITADMAAFIIITPLDAQGEALRALSMIPGQ